MPYNGFLFAEYNEGVRKARAEYDEARAVEEALESDRRRRITDALARRATRARERYAEDRRRKPNPPRPKPECGTDAGYVRHKRRGEDADAACLAAHSESTQEGRRRRRANAA